MSQVKARAALDSALGHISAALSRGDSVTLVDFGTFSVVDKKARASRNPRTGASIQIPAKTAVKFKAGKGLKASV